MPAHWKSRRNSLAAAGARAPRRLRRDCRGSESGPRDGEGGRKNRRAPRGFKALESAQAVRLGRLPQAAAAARTLRAVQDRRLLLKGLSGAQFLLFSLKSHRQHAFTKHRRGQVKA